MQNIVFPKRRINGKLQIFLRVKPYECTIDTFFFWNCQLPIKVIYRNRNYICFFCTIVIRSKNMCISNVTTKFGNLALSSMDYRSCHLNIVEYGTEYVRIDYTNKQKQQKFTVFEIVVSPYNLVVISQFDEVGNQINFSTY